MKKLNVFAIFAVVLSLLFCVVLCSCNKEGDKDNNTTPSTTASNVTTAPGGDNGTAEPDITTTPGGDDGTAEPNVTTAPGGDDGTTEPNVTTTDYVEETDPGLQDITDDPNSQFGEVHIAP